MNIKDFTPVTEFTYLGEKYKIERFKNFRRSRDFKKMAFPILAAELRPIEKLISSVSHEFVIEWGVIDAITTSEDNVDMYLLNALQKIISSQRDTVVVDEETCLLSPEEVWNIVYSQIREEKLVEAFLTQKLALLKDMQAILQLDLTDLVKSLTEATGRLGASNINSKVRSLISSIKIGDALGLKDAVKADGKEKQVS